MVKFLRSYYKEVGGLLAFIISICWVYDKGRNDEKINREAIIYTQTFQYQKRELKLKDSLKVQKNMIGELQKTIKTSNDSEIAIKIKDLELQKEGLENEKNEASNTIQTLLDSINSFSSDKDRIKELNVKLDLKKAEKDSVDFVLRGTKLELTQLKNTVHSIGQRNIQLSEDLSLSVVKYSSLDGSLPLLQEAFYHEKMADQTGNIQKKLECLFKAYEAYEKARTQNVFMKTDLWRIIRKINKFDSDRKVWQISNKGFSITIDQDLYWDLFKRSTISQNPLDSEGQNS